MSRPARAPREPEEMLARLSFIGALRPGEKVDVASLTVAPDTYLTSLWRTFVRGESREATLDFVRATVDEALAAAAAAAAAPDPLERRYAALLHAALRDATSGIASLAQTYADDRMYAKRVEASIVMLREELAQLALPPPAAAPATPAAAAAAPAAPEGRWSAQSLAGSPKQAI